MTNKIQALKSTFFWITKKSLSESQDRKWGKNFRFTDGKISRLLKAEDKFNSSVETF